MILKLFRKHVYKSSPVKKGGDVQMKGYFPVRVCGLPTKPDK